MLRGALDVRCDVEGVPQRLVIVTSYIDLSFSECRASVLIDESPCKLLPHRIAHSYTHFGKCQVLVFYVFQAI